MQRQLYKHVVLDTVLERRDTYRQRRTLKERQKRQLARLQEMVNADQLTRKNRETARAFLGPEARHFEVPIGHHSLLYRIWVHFKRFFVGENN